MKYISLIYYLFIINCKFILQARIRTSARENTDFTNRHGLSKRTHEISIADHEIRVLQLRWPGWCLWRSETGPGRGPAALSLYHFATTGRQSHWRRSRRLRWRSHGLRVHAKSCRVRKTIQIEKIYERHHRLFQIRPQAYRLLWLNNIVSDLCLFLFENI